MFNLHNIIRFTIGRELSEIYISLSIRDFAVSMISLFIPLFLIQNDFSLSEIILKFYIVLSFLYIVLSPMFVKIASKIGLKHSMTLSVPFLLAYFLLFYYLEYYRWPLPLLAISSVFATGFFWPALHIDFVKSTEAKNRGKEFGLLQILGLSSTTLGPIIGGIIITYFGFKILFVLASIILFISIFPLLLSNEVNQELRFNIKDFFKKNNLKPFIAFFGEGITTYANAVVWPIYIFLLIGSYLKLGLIGAVIALFTGIVMWLIAKLSDKGSRHRIMNIGSIFNSFTFILRMFTKKYLSLIAVSSLSAISFAIVNIPYHALFYGKASKKNLAEFVLFREIFVAIGRIFILLILFFSNSFIFTFFIAAFGTLLYKAFK